MIKIVFTKENKEITKTAIDVTKKVADFISFTGGCFAFGLMIGVAIDSLKRRKN